jgi:hypothetical protein
MACDVDAGFGECLAIDSHDAWAVGVNHLHHVFGYGEFNVVSVYVHDLLVVLRANHGARNRCGGAVGEGCLDGGDVAVFVAVAVDA